MIYLLFTVLFTFFYRCFGVKCYFCIFSFCYALSPLVMKWCYVLLLLVMYYYYFSVRGGVILIKKKIICCVFI